MPFTYGQLMKGLLIVVIMFPLWFYLMPAVVEILMKIVMIFIPDADVEYDLGNDEDGYVLESHRKYKKKFTEKRRQEIIEGFEMILIILFTIAYSAFGIWLILL